MNSSSAMKTTYGVSFLGEVLSCFRKGFSFIAYEMGTLLSFSEYCGDVTNFFLFVAQWPKNGEF